MLLELEAGARKDTDKGALSRNTTTYKFTRSIEEYQQLLLNPGGKDEHRNG